MLAYHAYLRGDPSNRRLLLSPIRFDAAGWPVVERPAGPATRAAPAAFGFGAALDAGWQWPARRRPAAQITRGSQVRGPGSLARQTGTTRFSATATLTARRGSARAGLAVMAQGGNAVGVELRGGRATAWRSDDGRLSTMGSRRLPPGPPVSGTWRLVLRVSVGDRVRLAVGMRGRWLPVGPPEPPPRWAGGAYAGLRVSGPAGARADFDSLAIHPRH